MYQVARAWPGRCVGLALVSLGFWGCDDAGRSKQPAPFGLESSDADSRNVARLDSALTGEDGAAGSASSLECTADDRSCNGVDDDCNGQVDEDFQARCVFGVVAATCVSGRIVNERCDDSSVCTVDSCTAQGCRHVPINCDDGNPCTADSCDALLGCQHTPALGAACDDGDVCTGAGSCDAAGSCQLGAPIDVDDEDPCTLDACDSQSGVTHTPAAGAVCDDAIGCTVDDRCDVTGSCQGTPTPVDDGNPCTTDACDSVQGETHVAAVGAACDDGNVCSQSDACTANGSCAGQPIPLPDDGNPCTAASCDPLTGAVAHRFVSGMSCSDGNTCNGAEVCQGLSEVAVTIDAKQTFLRTDSMDTSVAATAIRLADYGFAPGRRVRVYTTGQYSTPAVSQVQAMFSANATLYPPSALERIPGAIASDAPQSVSPFTLYQMLSTDLYGDWATDNVGFELTIPAGARYLFVGNSDNFYGDNSGALQFTMRALVEQCVAGEPANPGTACTLPGGASGVCNGGAMCQ